MYSGDDRKMVRPSTERGMPALGWAESGTRGDGAHALQGIQHGHRTDAAVDADDVGSPGFQLLAVVLGARAVEAVAVFVDGDLRHHRQLRIHLAGGQDRLVQFFQVAEGLQDDEVDAFFIQGSNLLAEGLAGLGQGNLCPAARCGFPAVRPPRLPAHRSSWRLRGPDGRRGG